MNILKTIIKAIVWGTIAIIAIRVIAIVLIVYGLLWFDTSL